MVVRGGSDVSCGEESDGRWAWCGGKTCFGLVYVRVIEQRDRRDGG
jgi:hypothetical protein